jgi:hypothetical protein
MQYFRFSAFSNLTICGKPAIGYNEALNIAT